LTTKEVSLITWLENQVGKTFHNFINGEWVKSNTNETFEIYNPAQKNQILGFFQASNEADVNQAVRAADQAFKTWSNVPGPERSAILMRFADLLEQHSEELAFILSAEQGKVLAESRGEVGRAVKETRFVAGEAFRIEGSTLPSEKSNISTTVLHRPLGVIAAIAPWNFPVVTPVRKIAPALAYGCTVVYKPASETPWTSVRLMELLAEAGVPNGVVNLVTGSGSKVGTPLSQHPLVKGISFTGSTEIGLGINERATKQLKKTQLELGGKNPAVVIDYHDVQYVANQIVSAGFACSGQRCTSISRVVVLKEKAEELVQSIRKEMELIKVGPASQQHATMGPVVSQAQLDTTLEYITAGKEEGATLIYGGDVLREGKFAEGYFIVPGLFTNVTPEMKIAKEEIFGPVLSVIEVKNVEEAIKVANDVKYGLAASVFTNDLTIAYRCVNEIQAGMVHVNHGTASQAHAPFGGVKESGYGAFSIGKTNKDFYTEMKVAYFQY
jgi:aldehyde dehydrogenase (NAD+)